MAETLAALYDNFNDARRAVEALVDAGYDRNDISIVANDVTGEHAQYVDNDVKGDQGAGFGAVVGTLVGLGVALIPGVGPVLAAGPAVAALFAGLGAAGGAITGGITASLVKFGVSEDDAHLYAEGVRRGGTLVTLQSTQDVSRARTILDQYGPVNIDERGSSYRESGFTRHSDDLPAYTTDQIHTERSRYSSTRTEGETIVDTGAGVGTTTGTSTTGAGLTTGTGTTTGTSRVRQYSSTTHNQN